MRIALINPKFRLPIDTRTTAHLGLAYLAAVSERRGDEVGIFDADVEEQPVSEFVQEFRPHLVGITANTPQVKQAWRTARAIKEVHDCLIVLGGPARQRAPGRELRETLRGCRRARRRGGGLDRHQRTPRGVSQGPAGVHHRGVHAPGERDLQGLPGRHLQDQRRPYHNNPDRSPSPTWTACPGPPTISSRWTATPTCSPPPTTSTAPAASPS